MGQLVWPKSSAITVMDQILNQFGIKPVLLLAQVVNFVILLLILRKFLYGPIIKVLEERKKKIADSLKNAEEIEKRLQEIGEKEAESLARSAKEGEKLIQQSSQAAAAMIDEAKAKYEKIINKAAEDGKTMLQTERNRLEREMKENLSNMVSLTFKKITGKAMGREQKALLTKTVKELK